MVRSQQAQSEQSSEAGNDLQTIKDDLARLRDDVSNLATQWMSRGKERVQSAGDDFQDRIHSSMDGVQDWVKQRPIQTIVMAGLAGLILGKILRR